MNSVSRKDLSGYAQPQANYCGSRQATMTLITNLLAYWQKAHRTARFSDGPPIEGCKDVTFWIESAPVRNNSPLVCIRSNLVNGLPPK